MLIRRGFLTLLAPYLSAGADINTTRGVCSTAVHAASVAGFVEVIKLFLSGGADANTIMGHFETALQVAPCNDWRDVVQYLLEAGADVRLAGRPYRTALQIVLELPDWSLHDNHKVQYEETATLLLYAGANVNNPGEEYSRALELAEDKGCLKVAKLLREKGARTRADLPFEDLCDTDTGG